MRTNPLRVDKLKALILNNDLQIWKNRAVGTASALGRLIDISRSTISRAHRKGKVRGYEISGACFGIDAEDLLRYLQTERPGRKPSSN